MHRREEGHPIPGHDHIVALHSVVLLTLAPDQDPGQDPGLTPIPPADPAPVHAPMAGLTHAPLIPDEMGAVMAAHVQGPAHVQGLLDIGVLDHQGLPLPSGEEPGREQRGQDPFALGHSLGLLVASGAEALVGESHHQGSLNHMN